MLLKLLSSAVIIGGCALAGIIYSNRFSQRSRILSQFQTALHQLEVQVLYTAIPLPEALERAAQSNHGIVGNFLLRLSQEIRSKKGYSMEEIWRKALQEEEEFKVLKREDYELLFQFGIGLGTSDRENQKKNFELTQYQLKGQVKKAEEDRTKNEGLYRNLGFLGGLMIAIILF